MKDVFLHQVGKHICNAFKKHREHNIKPLFVSDKDGRRMTTIRKTDPNMVRQALVNRENRLSKRSREAGTFRGGSRKLSKWMEDMEESGSTSMISEAVKKLWSKEDGTGLGERPVAIIAEFERLVVEEQGDDESPQPISSAKATKLWIKACDGHANRRIFALVEEGVAVVHTGRVDACFSSHSSSKFNTQPAVEPLTDVMKEMREEMKTLQAQNAEIQSQKKALKDMLERLMQHIGGNMNIVSN